ncbi:hypothetical protein CRYUN_Cryun11dG0006100 [Craigia yunnanensis]
MSRLEDQGTRPSHQAQGGTVSALPPCMQAPSGAVTTELLAIGIASGGSVGSHLSLLANSKSQPISDTLQAQ